MQCRVNTKSTMVPNRAAGDRYILVEQQSKEKQVIRLVPSYFIARALSLLRWGLIAMLLLLTILHPTSGRLGLPSWGWLLLLAVYNLAGDLFLRACPPSKWPRVLVIRSMLDLPVVGTIYLLSGHAGGPLFTLYFLATVCGATVLSLRATFVYTASSVALAALLEPGLLLPALENSGDRSLGARLVVLAFTGAGAAILKRGLALEHNYLPPTINLQEPDPECDLDYVPGTGRHQRINTAISNSFGFGGINACLVLGRS